MTISALNLRTSDTLTDIVTARLRLAIVTGALGPGERISEPRLADQLQVSRSPVREALHHVSPTLLGTIALLVLVIFLFLRRFVAPVIPTLSLPVSLIGAGPLQWWLN